MNLRCACGEMFNLSYKQHKQILPEFDLFCSPECVLDYINNFEPKVVTVPAMKNKLSEAIECWDMVTKRNYRSLYELYFARYLHRNKVYFKYEPHTFQIDTKTYTPDFYLPLQRLYVEIKGRWATGSKKKVRTISDDINLIVLPGYLQSQFKKEIMS